MVTGLTFEALIIHLLTGVLPLVLFTAKSIETYRLLLADIRKQQYIYKFNQQFTVI